MRAKGISESSAHETIWARLTPLRKKPYTDLQVLPNTEIQLQVDGIEATLCIFPDVQKNGSVWVIGQLVTPQEPFLLVFSSHQQFAQGFETRPDGSVRDLGERELDYFT